MFAFVFRPSLRVFTCSTSQFREGIFQVLERHTGPYIGQGSFRGSDLVACLADGKETNVFASSMPEWKQLEWCPLLSSVPLHVSPELTHLTKTPLQTENGAKCGVFPSRLPEPALDTHLWGRTRQVLRLAWY